VEKFKRRRQWGRWERVGGDSPRPHMKKLVKVKTFGVVPFRKVCRGSDSSPFQTHDQTIGFGGGNAGSQKKKTRKGGDGGHEEGEAKEIEATCAIFRTGRLITEKGGEELNTINPNLLGKGCRGIKVGDAWCRGGEGTEQCSYIERKRSILKGGEKSQSGNRRFPRVNWPKVLGASPRAGRCWVVFFGRGGWVVLWGGWWVGVGRL